MNIVVFKQDHGEFYYKPDSTLQRESCEIYRPDYIEGYGINLTFFGRLEKGAKYVSREFAKRYYKQCGFGLELTPHFNTQKSSIKPSPFVSLCLDRSFITFPDYIKIEELDNDSVFETLLTIDNNIYHISLPISKLLLEIDAAIEKITPYFSLKSGDFVAINIDDSPSVMVSNICNLQINNQDLLSVKIL